MESLTWSAVPTFELSGAQKGTKIIKGLEDLSCEERLREPRQFCPEKL